MKKSNYLTLQDITLSIVSMVLTVVFARVLTKEAYGMYSQVFLIVGFTSALVGSAIPMGLSYFYGQYKSFTQRQLLFKRFFITFKFMALFMGGVFLVFNDTISNAFSNNFIVEYKYLIFILIVFSIVNGFFKNFSLLTNRSLYIFRPKLGSLNGPL